MITDLSTAPGMEAPLNIVYMRGIREKVFGELCLMAQQLGMRIADEPFATIYRTAAEHLFAIENLCCDGDIDPRAWVCASHDDEPCLPYPRSLRVGFYPIAANPLHWGHLLIGLRAMACLQLDKVVYVISGRDPRKPDMCCADQRYIMARDTLKLFGPLFACSSLARYSGCDGETNLFRFLKLNRQQPMDMFYIAGGDHYRRFYPGTEYPDTLVKLELHMDTRIFSYKPAMHAISAAFIERGAGAHEAHVETCLAVHFFEALPFEASSTMIRAALAGTGPRSDLPLLPYASFTDIQALNLYGLQPFAAGLMRRSQLRYAEAAIPVAC
jgi:nicotinic acid mononucleotide adenylyltransferase